MIKVKFIYYIFSVIGVFFALFVNSFLFNLGDSSGYLTSEVSIESSIFFKRTDFITFIYSFFTSYFFQLPIITLIVISIFLALLKLKVVSFYFSNSINYQQNFLLGILFFSIPSFLAFSSVAGKEQFFFFLALLFLLLIKQLLVLKSKLTYLLILVTLIAMVFVRSVYALPFILLFLFLYFLINHKFIILNIFSFRYIIYIFLLLVWFLSFDFLSPYYSDIISNAKNYFYGYSGSTTRYFENWSSSSDLFSHAFLGSFIVLFNVFPSEAFESNRYIFFYIEGFLKYSLPIFWIYSSYFSRPINSTSKMLLHFFIVSNLIIVFLSYPLSYVNIGSSLRYQQNFLYYLFSSSFIISYLLRSNKY